MPQGHSKLPLGDPNCESSPQSPIIPVLPSTPPYRQVGICGNNWAVSPDKHAKRKPTNQRVLRPLLFRWWLCSIATPKQHQAVLGSTKMRVQKPVPAIPTLWLWFCRPVIPVAPSFRPVSSRVPPSSAMSCFVGFGDKSWDSSKTHLKPRALSLHFCPKGVTDDCRGFNSVENAILKLKRTFRAQAAGCDCE